MTIHTVETCLVAGASGALGKQILHQLIKKKLKVVGICYKEEDSQATLKELRQHFSQEELTKLNLICGDLQDPLQVGNLINQAKNWLGSIDAFFHAVGCFRYNLVKDSSENDYDILFGANFKSVWLPSRLLIKDMQERGFGRMVFTSSYATLGQGSPGTALYVASKAALNAFIQSMQKEVLTTDIAINAVLPTILDTPQNRADIPKGKYDLWVDPKQLAAFMCSLLEPHARQLRGALIAYPANV